jgi:hypothetical protein
LNSCGIAIAGYEIKTISTFYEGRPPMIKKILPVIALLFLFSGCMGMNQIHINKDRHGNTTRTSERIATEEPEVYSYPEVNVENLNSASVLVEIEPRPDAITVENSPSSRVTDKSPATDKISKSAGFDINIIRTGLILPFTTNFQSSSFKNLKWNSETEADGPGYEANVHFSQDQRFDLTAGGGVFKSRTRTNSWEENGIYVIETTRAESYWVHGAVIFKPNSWVYAEGLLGLFYYKLKTDAVTNAPVFAYDGLSGNDIFGAYGIGGGIKSPWKGRLQLFSGIRFWFPMSRYFDYYAVQVNAGFSYSF